MMTTAASKGLFGTDAVLQALTTLGGRATTNEIATKNPTLYPYPSHKQRMTSIGDKLELLRKWNQVSRIYDRTIKRNVWVIAKDLHPTSSNPITVVLYNDSIEHKVRAKAGMMTQYNSQA